VLTREDQAGNHVLCGYIAADTELTVTELREYLGRELPDYMIPAYFVQVDAIPLTPGGKVDRTALKKLESRHLLQTVAYVAPEGDREQLLADLCREVLKQERVGVTDNLFSLGATSFDIIQLTHRLGQELKMDIPVITLFEYPTIAAFLEHINHNQVHELDNREESEWLAARSRGKAKLKQRRQRNLGED
jgi:gramicidin S synthase 2/tyrocidine synthetase-3